MSLQKVLECCEHTRPITYPCQPCFLKRLEEAGQRWKAEGKLASDEEIRQLNEKLALAEERVKSLTSADDSLVLMIRRQQAEKESLRLRLSKALEDVSGLSAQLNAERASKMMKTAVRA